MGLMRFSWEGASSGNAAVLCRGGAAWRAAVQQNHRQLDISILRKSKKHHEVLKPIKKKHIKSSKKQRGIKKAEEFILAHFMSAQNCWDSFDLVTPRPACLNLHKNATFFGQQLLFGRDSLEGELASL